jgi:hypothetical protein
MKNSASSSVFKSKTAFILNGKKGVTHNRRRVKGPDFRIFQNNNNTGMERG